ncbi:G-type lectin S-receptor-like serine/threonine-protein kinase At4g27290 [Lotus japonicus]|uniref:G-type lectin S-receptor-like serine/threonine-protein kinase At4g27290 n=1 Tax=Lotus japonicus TaxID=34305 RepID=UPI00258A3AE3|nr:G-type lectin S-receptor-like serine/threonine-protein kinase At4g27290 [Lotus japonicus]
MVNNILMSFIWFLLFSHVIRTSTSSTSLDTLAVNQSIRDGESLVSAGGIIEMGFFSPGSSKSRYLGVWYKNVSPITVIWVANRETPLQNNSGVLKFNAKGFLQLLNGTTNSTIIWSSNTTSKAGNMNNPIAHLQDSGNLVVKNGQESNDFLWQSFDYPGDTLMPGLKLGWNLEIGLQRFISSWKSADDPAEGEYAMKLDIRGYPQMIQFKGPDIDYRPGPWLGEFLAGFQGPVPAVQTFVFNEKEVYYKYKHSEMSIISMYKLLPSGAAKALFWAVGSYNQQNYSIRVDECDDYAYCGASSICTMDSNLPTCECLKGYVPKFPQQWKVYYWKNGCVPKNESNCENNITHKTEGFFKYTQTKYPDTSSSWFNKSMNLEDCKLACLRNCSCVACANLDTRNGGTGCLLWFNYLVDVRKFSQWGQDLYVKVPLSELDHVAAENHGNIKKIIGITVAVTISGLVTWGSIWMIKNPGAARNTFSFSKRYKRNLRKEDVDLSTFDFSVLANATKNFSSGNKLGEGGFGPVYKGMLPDGQEIAVKRLSKRSGQGLEEFKNEVALISKLQHRNLIKLLGYFIQGEETMLIYEYMPNKSLDYFVFDETKSMSLDWLKRFNIIGSIARGLLYLHQDSRLRIIHRDLKASNILLDVNLEPKISDFGLARIFLGDQIEDNTNRVAGTYGYISPEYAVHGHFSVKSDVFSYGVIVLEIVSGKKNREFSDPKHRHNLLGYAWRLWTEERALELLDEVLREQYTPFEVMRSIQVSLLCVQQRPEDRPDMSSVVLMLNGEKLLPKPKVPGFYNEKDLSAESNSSPANHKLCSVNELSITELDAR